MTFVSQFTQLSGICVLWIVVKYLLQFQHLFSPGNLRGMGGGVHPFKKEIYLVKKIKIKTTKEYKVNHPQITEGKAARVPRFVRVTHTRVSPTAQAYHIHSPRCAFLTEHRLL